MKTNSTRVGIDDWTGVNRELDNIRNVIEKLRVFYGNGSPENEVEAPLGAVYSDLEGGTPTFYVKQSNDNESSGWVSTLTSASVPVGAIFTYPTSTAPSGYLLCNGSAISRTTYSSLFAIIGVTHGQGDGANTFNLPDYRGRLLRGVDNAVGRDPDAATRTAMAAGGNTGDNVGSVQTEATKLPTTPFTTDDPGTHTHPVTGWGINAAVNDGGGGNVVRTSGDGAVEAGGAHTHSVTGGGDNETRPLNAYVEWIIKY